MKSPKLMSSWMGENRELFPWDKKYGKVVQSLDSHWVQPLLFNIVLEVLASAIRQQNEIKDIQISKEAKLSLFTDDIILDMENLRDSTKRLLDLINEGSKVPGYKISVQKLVACTYTNDKAKERETKKIIPSATTPRTIKYLVINLTKI